MKKSLDILRHCKTQPSHLFVYNKKGNNNFSSFPFKTKSRFVFNFKVVKHTFRALRSLRHVRTCSHYALFLLKTNKKERIQFDQRDCIPMITLTFVLNALRTALKHVIILIHEIMYTANAMIHRFNGNYFIKSNAQGFSYIRGHQT